MQLVGITQLVCIYLHRGVVEVVSRLAHNQEVEGSNPSPATIINYPNPKKWNFLKIQTQQSRL